MPIVFHHARLLQDPDICTCVPYLRTSQTIPAEGQDIISGSQGCWNIHLILESPIIAGRYIFGNVHFSPFWPRWSCPNRGRFQFHWYPTPLEILWLGDPWLPIKPRSFLIYPTLSDCLVYKWMDIEWMELNKLASNFCSLPENLRCPFWKHSSVTFQYSPL